jgi:ring-1,2-phenylacetyl-CoA epoxidase subunit PaaE
VAEFNVKIMTATTGQRGFYPLRVKEVKRETADAISISFEVGPEQEADFDFIAGQYLTLKIALNGEELRRSYSICAAPEQNELKIAVKRVDQGKVSTYLDGQLRAGDVLEVMRPMGNFTLNGSQDGTYFAFAAGSGITPVMSILKSVLLNSGTSRFVLIYGNKQQEDIIFREELEELALRFRERLRVVHVLSQENKEGNFHGRIDAQLIQTLADSGLEMGNGQQYFICGPSAMIEVVSSTLEGKGIPSSKICYELFSTPAPIEDEEETEVIVEAAANNPIATVRILLDEDETEIELKKDGASVLDAAIKAGIDPPYSCKGAVCTTCMAKVLHGKVRMDMNHALSDGEIEEGYVLTCQSHPVTDEVSISYDDI